MPVLQSVEPVAAEAPAAAPVVLGARPGVVPKQVTWTGPNGDRITLTDHGQGYAHGWGRAGLGGVPFDLRWDDLATGGARLRDIRAVPRTLSWPQIVLGDDQAQFDARWGRLLASMMHTSERAPGRLEVTHFDGRVRYVDAWYLDGLEGEEEPETWHGTSCIAPLRLVALDPYFQSLEESTATFSLADTTKPILDNDGFLPVEVSPSVISGVVAVWNVGDAEAWPVVELTGPGRVPVVRNNTAGMELRFSRDLVAGDRITIDARERTVVDASGASWRRHLTYPGSRFWPLLKGRNGLAVTMAGTGSTSSVTVRYRARWVRP